MIDLSKELLNFSYREIDVSFNEIFPRLNKGKVVQQSRRFAWKDSHQTVYTAARGLWLRDFGYETILEENGFWDTRYPQFSGHCHQCTPTLGLVLDSLDFNVSYLECQRIDNRFIETGIMEKVPPEQEPNPVMGGEFCCIGRIPYCCLEVRIGTQLFYLTGKHLKPQGYGAVALLNPQCYRDHVGFFPHQDDKHKSGIYLEPVTPHNPQNLDFRRQIVWKKQTVRDPEPELFATYLRMNLV